MERAAGTARGNDVALAHGLDPRRRRPCAAPIVPLIVEVDRRELWKRDGAHDMAHWLWMRYGISDWKARRWIDAARALASLPDQSRRSPRGGSGWTRSWS